MRPLLDVNLDTRVATGLIAAGHDVERAILTTCDRNFGELVFRRAVMLPPGIVYLRLRARDVELAIARLLPLLDTPDVKNHMTVVDDRRTRHTLFPGRSGHHA